jgi:hypothetical protein
LNELARLVTVSVMSEKLDPAPILQTAFAFWSSKVLRGGAGCVHGGQIRIAIWPAKEVNSAATTD